MFLSGPFLQKLDSNGDDAVSHDEFARGFAKWFSDWNTSKTDSLSESDLRAGIDRTFGPPGMRNDP
jgi:hypothetical protein